MSQSPLDFRDGVFAAFDTFWADRTPVSYPNVEFKPEDVTGDAWVEIIIVGAVDGREPFGDSVNSGVNEWVSGALGVGVYVRGDTSTNLAYELAAAAATFMQTQVIKIPNTLLRRLSAPQEIGPDGTWWQVNQTCDFAYLNVNG